MRHPWSFRDHLVFGIGFALTSSRSLLRRILSEHAPDDARRELANRVVTHLERSGEVLRPERTRQRSSPPRWKNRSVPPSRVVDTHLVAFESGDQRQMSDGRLYHEGFCVKSAKPIAIAAE